MDLGAAETLILELILQGQSIYASFTRLIVNIMSVALSLLLRFRLPIFEDFASSLSSRTFATSTWIKYNLSSLTYNDTMVTLSRVAQHTLPRLGPLEGGNLNGCQHVSYRSLEWSSDGTCLIATSSLNSIDTFVVPQDLLAPRDVPLQLSLTTSITSASVVRAVVGHPGFDLQDPGTMLVLSSVRDHPIRLSSAFTTDVVASYPLINAMTEEYITPHSLIFNPNNGSFVAGSDSRVSFFDVSRPGEGPMSSLSTKNEFNPAASQSGIVSALALEPRRALLAAGTFARSLGLYEAGGRGECIATFGLRDNEADEHIGGTGITQVQWSPCGNYLYVAERKSDGIVVFDTRKTCQLLSWLEGRSARTNQRLGLDLTKGPTDTQEVWAGGVDGTLRVWKDAHTKEGPVKPDLEHAVHGGKCKLNLISRCDIDIE